MSIDNTDYEALSEYYMQRSQVFEAFYSERLRSAQAFIILEGIITQLNSDIVVYELKHGKNGKIKEARERVEGLQLVHDHFMGIDERNLKMRYLVQENLGRMEILQKENEQLKKEKEFNQ